jgi:hypothetical protein
MAIQGQQKKMRRGQHPRILEKLQKKGDTYVAEAF